MTLEEEILNAVRALPPDKQQEVLEHATQLRGEGNRSERARKSGRGLWADLKIDLSAEDVDEVRREMWKNFPRNDF